MWSGKVVVWAVEETHKYLQTTSLLSLSFCRVFPFSVWSAAGSDSPNVWRVPGNVCRRVFLFLISTSNIWTFYRLAAVVRCRLSYLVIPWFNFVFVVFVCMWQTGREPQVSRTHQWWPIGLSLPLCSLCILIAAFWVPRPPEMKAQVRHL